MRLSALIDPILHKTIYYTNRADEIDIESITADSRQVEQNSLFVCVPGHTVDGHDFAQAAVERGAVALLVEKLLEIDIPQVLVPNVSSVLSIIANRFYGQPTQHLQLIGITGTNGKTTTTYLVEKIYNDYGKKTGVIGTIEMRIGEKKYPVQNTTPEPLTLQRAFRQMVDEGVDVAIIEVSSHALELARVAGCDFNVAAFTNVTQDHLDFHKDMNDYVQAKTKLFSRLGNTYDFDKGLSFAVLNADDPYCERFADATVAQKLTYGIDNQADVRATNVVVKAEGVRFHVDAGLFGASDVALNITGKFSVYNALTAISICLLQGLPLSDIVASLESVKRIPGRFEKVDLQKDFTVIVDYAHTADSLENVLSTIQEFAANRIITVFGCGGDRDRSKRPLMGRAARKYSDIVIITSDNPRTEDPARIIDDIMEAFHDAPEGSYIREDDRAKAIQHAIKIAHAGDVILIAGKGHETYQIIGKQKYDFDDRLIAMEAGKALNTQTSDK